MRSKHRSRTSWPINYHGAFVRTLELSDHRKWLSGPHWLCYARWHSPGDRNPWVPLESIFFQACPGDVARFCMAVVANSTNPPPPPSTGLQHITGRVVLIYDADASSFKNDVSGWDGAAPATCWLLSDPVTDGYPLYHETHHVAARSGMEGSKNCEVEEDTGKGSKETSRLVKLVKKWKLNARAKDEEDSAEKHPLSEPLLKQVE
ncbi:hypothetical protein KFL_000390380 [Klebsormidium nitens]|uniref:Uncharacterized protein n=1 Tax=Klebsormidium nitens TaxID=105231 RepID=A0A1Y1HRQ9_KLENI|nr:hypothetical protein KFL_000390380 [Klebsormidium nitens]|eukprot:GAQ79849.1 hypothetical protein KFL_000390380 [Klebsormidium nitens]